MSPSDKRAAVENRHVLFHWLFLQQGFLHHTARQVLEKSLRGEVNICWVLLLIKHLTVLLLLVVFLPAVLKNSC